MISINISWEYLFAIGAILFITGLFSIWGRWEESKKPKKLFSLLIEKPLSDLNETTQSILYNVGRVSDRVDEIAESNTKFQDS